MGTHETGSSGLTPVQVEEAGYLTGGFWATQGFIVLWDNLGNPRAVMSGMHNAGQAKYYEPIQTPKGEIEWVASWATPEDIHPALRIELNRAGEEVLTINTIWDIEVTNKEDE